MKASREQREELAEALTRTGRQDARAFRHLYRLTSAKLFGVCLRICGERRAAEDVLQEVYLTIWNRSRSYDSSRGSPIAWLAAIARNRAIDWRRSHPIRPEAQIDAAREVADDHPAADTAIETGQEQDILLRHLDDLEPRQREAIRAAFFEGLTYTELAEREGVPLGTMKSWVRRGLLRLRERLDDDA